MKTEDINKMARALKQVQETFNDTRPGTKQNQKDFDKAAKMAKPKDKVSLKPMPASLAKKMAKDEGYGSKVKSEALKGDQHKLDHDKDGDIDAKDFAHMRKKKKSGKEEVTMNAKVGSEKGTTDEQKEGTTWTVYKKIMEKREMHAKGATEAEKIDSKDSPGGKKMRQDIAVDTSGKVSNYDDLGHDDASKAARATKTSPARNGDNKAGDKNVMNAPEDITKKAGMKA